MKYEVKFTNQFKKDLKLAKKQNKDLDKLFEVVNILVLMLYRLGTHSELFRK